MSVETEIIQAAAPSWVTTMRDAAQKVLKQEDVEEIVRNQIAAAKKGDRNAIKFVFEQVLGGQQVKAGTIIQNNYHGAATEGPRLAEDGPASEWKCDGCGTRALSHAPPTKCRTCDRSRFTRLARKAI